MTTGNNISPPKLAVRLLCAFLRHDLQEEVSGDLEEKFYQKLKQTSPFRARASYWYQVVHYIRPFAIRKSNYVRSNNMAMLSNYITIGIRHLLRKKAYSFINVTGLSAGMAVTMLIALWIHDELTYNQYFDHYDRIARVMQNQTFNGKVETWTSQARQIGPALRDNYAADFEYVVMTSGNRPHKLTYGDNNINKRGSYMEPDVADMLSLHMVSGTRRGLDDMHGVLLSTSTATALFGDEDPLDKAVRIEDQLDVKVTGVYEDLPANTNFNDMAFIASWQLYVVSENIEARTGWGNSWFECFVQIADNADMVEVSAKIKDTKLNAVRAAGDDDDRFKPEIFLHPMPRWRLHSIFENGVYAGGGIQYVRMFGTVGAFVLLLACINFINLSTARSEKRSKEVGIRKSIGSIRWQLIGQFFTESVVVVAIAFMVAVLVVALVLPWFNALTGKQLGLPWESLSFYLAGMLLAGGVAIMAGSFPAFYLSSFDPARALKGAFRSGTSSSFSRKILVIVQFTISVTLITGTIVVFKQIEFARSRPVGYSTNGLITIPLRSNEIRDHFDAFSETMKATGVVEQLSLTNSPITSTYTTNSGFTWKGKDPAMTEEFVTMRVTHDFSKVAQWEVIDGRDFSRAFPSDSIAFILNESAVKYMGLENPVGETMKWGEGYDYQIVGVVKDLVTQSPYIPVKQMFFVLDYRRVGYVTLRLRPDVSATEAILKMESVFAQFDPANPMEYSFVDQDFAQKFEGEKRVGQLALVFATLAILISSLGLLGLASFLAEQRTKEVGIRKVLGASVPRLWGMLSRDFVILVALSCGLAFPVAYYLMSGWLDNYDYRTPISWWIFIVTGVGALGITLLTVSFHAVKAATANPVHSLRSE
jgi:ABC-type antimicrobial peptide transport system permease subunit